MQIAEVGISFNCRCICFVVHVTFCFQVGFDPDTGEWYYLTMRPDKTASNHISTVLGTLLELAESLGTNELRYRMNVTGAMRDTYRKEVRKCQSQILKFQRDEIKLLNGKR